MKGLHLIKILNRLSLIYAIVSFLIVNTDYRDLGALVFLWQILWSYIIFKNKDRKAVCLIIPLVFLPLLKIHDTSLLISTILIGAYAVFFALRGLSQISYNMAVEEFEKGGIALGILFGMSVIFINLGLLGISSGYYIIIYLLSSIILLRLLRNIDYNKGDKRVEKINLIYSIALTFTTAMVSISYVREGIVKAVYSLYNLITNLFMYVFSWLFLGIGMIMERIFKFLWYLMGKRTLKGTEIGGSSRGQFTLDELNRKSLLEALLENTFINTTLRIIAIALVVYMVFRIFKKMSKGYETKEEDYTETREFIGTGNLKLNSLIKKAADLIKPKTSYEKIRFYYRKYLKKSAENGIDIEKSDTTLDIMIKTKYKFNNASLAEMRKIYVNIRYGNFCANKEQLERFIMNYRNLNKD